MSTPGSGRIGTERPAHPQQILDDDGLSEQEKRDYLEDWRLDLVEQQTATAENMPPRGAPNQDSKIDEQLRRVSDALATLKR